MLRFLYKHRWKIFIFFAVLIVYMLYIQYKNPTVEETTNQIQSENTINV